MEYWDVRQVGVVEKSSYRRRRSVADEYAGPTIRVEGLLKYYGRKCVLDNISFDIGAGEFVAIVGPSGCGKTTLLNIIAGFQPFDRGQVLIDGNQARGPGPDRVIVSQDLALFEWKSVLDNAAFAARARGVDRIGAQREARHYLSLVRLLDDSHHKYPGMLSGGMRQRLALARALVGHPRCMLLDEPLGSLDYQLRLLLQEELSSLWQQTGITTLLVTHDVEEAVFLADRILCLSSFGKLTEIDNGLLPRPRARADRTSQAFQRIRSHVLNRLELLPVPSQESGQDRLI